MKLKDMAYQQPWIQKFVHPFAVRRYLRKWAKAGPRVQGKGHTVVVLNHCYDQDLEAICLAGAGEETIWALESSRIFKIVHGFIPWKLSQLILANEDPRVAPHMAEYEKRFVKPFVDFLVKTTNLDVLLCPSDVFFWLRPVLAELRRRGVTLMVQDKEGAIAPNPAIVTANHNLRALFPPMSDHYYYWNEKHLWMETTTGVPSDRVTVIGQPRSDYFFHPERWPSRKDLGLPENSKIILFYSFDTNAYVRTERVTRTTETPWTQMRNEIMQTLADVVKRVPDTYLVVKAHPQQENLWQDLEEFRRLKIPQAQFITGAAASNALLAHAQIVTGFQTTAMIEAMMMDKPVIYTGWGPEHEVYESRCCRSRAPVVAMSLKIGKSLKKCCFTI